MQADGNWGGVVRICLELQFILRPFPPAVGGVGGGGEGSLGGLRSVMYGPFSGVRSRSATACARAEDASWGREVRIREAERGRGRVAGGESGIGAPREGEGEGEGEGGCEDEGLEGAGEDISC